MPITVLLADDHNEVRAGVRRLLQKDPEIELIAEAENFVQMITRAQDLKPQVVLLDLHMPSRHQTVILDVNGALASIQAHILAISFSNDDEAQVLAASFGAHCLLDRTKLAEELIPAIRNLSADSGN
jgi:DNA-binding NarL/FixJ family response regulator